jgi:Protein of unknown function (DUF1116)
MVDTDAANKVACERLANAEPTLVDIRPALEVVPGMTPTTILTSGAPLAWEQYTGGQRNAILYGALFEGLARDIDDAETKLASGSIRVESTHAHGCVGSVAGIYTASMPVFVVENSQHGNRGFCNFYEGESRHRLNYGSWNDEVRRGLLFIQDVLAPTLAEVVQRTGGIPLKPIIRRALNMGDELHSRNTAATVLFTREIFPAMIDLAVDGEADRVREVFNFLRQSEYSFLRLSMAAAKATADAAHGVEGSSVVTAMTISCQDFAIRVSGLGDTWYRGPLPVVEGRLFEGFTEADIEWIGGESHITETVGLGGFAQAAAFSLQDYQGGSPHAMVANNLAMYDITVGEHPDYKIPYLGYRGTPIGIDVHRVVEHDVVPVIDGGLAGRNGGQIGAGILRAPMACFTAARAAYQQRYGAE